MGNLRYRLTHRASARLALAAVAGLSLLLGVARIGAQTPVAERPTYQVGDRWIRNDGTYELKRIDKGVYYFSAGRGNEIRLTQNLEIFQVIRESRVEFFIEPGLRFRWPIEVNRSQRYRVNWNGPVGRPIRDFLNTVDITWKVEPPSDVTVPAGTFKAYRILYSFEGQTAGFGSGERIGDAELWYAPDAKRLVKGYSARHPALNFEVTGLDDRAAPVIATPAPAPPATPPPVAPPAVAATPPTRVTPAQAPAPSDTAAPPDTEGPKITINHPADGARVDREELVVVAAVTDNISVDRVLVSVNGRMVSSDQAGGQRGHTIRTPVTLRPGQNLIEVSAADKAGNVTQIVRSVTFTGTATASPPPPPKHDQWAVVIGISNYESPSIPRLKYSVADADAFYRILTGPMGLKKENVILLTDRAERKPTLKNVKWALGTFLSRAALKNDTVYVFFAGHGAPEADLRGVERDGLSKYLIPQDADPDDLYTTALPMDELQNIFDRIEAERMVVFLDACYSGAGGEKRFVARTFAAKSTRAGAVDDQFLERLARTKGRAIVTASRTNEVSYELPELGHGIFTYYLVEGLRGAADLNRDGIVTLQELYDYLEEQVTRKSKSVGGNQHPVMKSLMEGTLPLTRVKP